MQENFLYFWEHARQQFSLIMCRMMIVNEQFLEIMLNHSNQFITKCHEYYNNIFKIVRVINLSRGCDAILILDEYQKNIHNLRKAAFHR